MDGNSIDFANSRSDSYRASNESVMDELNAYFKSYIAGHTDNLVTSKETTPEEALEGIFDRAGFDDAMDMINREKSHEKGSSGRYSSSSSSSSDSDSEDDLHAGITDFANDATNGLLDVEILDQHIDKANLNGGSDATRAIENMAGGSLSAPTEPMELDDIDAPNPADDSINDFANAMLGTRTVNGSAMNGGGYRKPTIDNSGSVRGYSGVTSEIRMKGNRVTERERKGSNYLSEDGYVDMAMLGGSFEDHAEVDNEGDAEGDEKINGDWEDDENATRGKGEKETFDGEKEPVAEEGTQEPSEKIDIVAELEGRSYSEDDLSDVDEEFDDSDHQDTANMASEIDHVLNQLRNKTARTLTGGTVNIRKKVVLTDMYPYIIRT